MDLHIKDVLKNYIKADKKVGNGYYSKKIEAFWHSRFAPSIANRTRKVEFRNGLVYIVVESAPLRNELFNNKTKIISEINQHLEENLVSDIIFK